MSHKRQGLTLIEILVVIGILSLLLSLLFPAIQYIRESARKSACLNNLKQQVLSINNFESSHAELPSFYNGSFLKTPQLAVHDFAFHSWRTQLLPTLDQHSLYNQIDFDLPATIAANQQNLNISLSVFQCPSTSNQNKIVPDIYEYNGDKIPTKIVGTAARADYEVIAGVHTPPEYLADGTIKTPGIRFGIWGDWDRQQSLSSQRPYHRPGRLNHVSDGLSNTLMLGERAGRPDVYERGELIDDYPYTEKGPDHYQATWGLSTATWWFVLHYDQPINATNATGIYSFHHGGANVCFADGSAQFLSGSMDQETLNALATRSGGEPVILK